jgi:nitrogen fixation protein FixH
MEGTSSSPAPRQSRRWPIIIIALLGCHVLLMVTVAAIAVRDPSFTVLPNYYQKALNWDEDQARRIESAKLGWSVKVEPATTVSPLGARSIKFLLRDKDGQPVDGATLGVSYYHHAHAGELAEVDLKQVAAGEFEARLPMRQTGFWQFEISATTADHSFSTSLTRFVETEAIR